MDRQDTVDVYWLLRQWRHRAVEEVPKTGEFHKMRGRIKLERIDVAIREIGHELAKLNEIDPIEFTTGRTESSP